MSEHRGYTGKSLSLLTDNDVKVGDTIKILGDLTYIGILMPRYESNDDEHIVIKLKSGYNVGIEISQIKNLEKLEASHQPKEETKEEIKTRENLPNVLLLSTGGTIASKVGLEIHQQLAIVPPVDKSKTFGNAELFLISDLVSFLGRFDDSSFIFLI